MCTAVNKIDSSSTIQDVKLWLSDKADDHSHITTFTSKNLIGNTLTHIRIGDDENGIVDFHISTNTANEDIAPLKTIVSVLEEVIDAYESNEKKE